jgi:hypothetical protein
MQDTSTVFQQQQSRFGGRGAAPIAFEQGLTQLNFQKPNLAA